MADESSREVEAQKSASQMLREAMPQPAVREGSGAATLIEGWLFKGSFNLSTEADSVKGKMSLLKPWNKVSWLAERATERA